MRLDAPFARHIFLQRGIDAAEHAGNPQLRIAGNVELRQTSKRRFPHLRADFLQTQNDVEQRAALKAKRPRSRSDRTKIEKAAALLVLLVELVRLVTFGETAREIRLSLEIVFVGIVATDERHA